MSGETQTTPLSKLPKVAAIVAFVAGALSLPGLLPTLIPLAGGIGILKRRIWSAYGLGLYCLAEVITAVVLAKRGESSSIMVPFAVVSALLACLFAATGRALARMNADSGRALPWIAVSAVCGFTPVFLAPFIMPSASMNNTMFIGDHFLVRTSGPSGVTRGDIIAFRYPLMPEQYYIKRVIGLPGDRIRFVDRRLMLDGHLVDEPYVVHSQLNYRVLYRDNFPAGAGGESLRPRAAEMIEKYVVNGELVVPAGQIFAVGDNRDDSDDSRYWGFVPSENILGKPVMIYWSFDPPTVDLANANPGIDHIVDVVTHFFTRTRWSRTFKLLRGYPLK
jgi:signal peptidase I